LSQYLIIETNERDVDNPLLKHKEFAKADSVREYKRIRLFPKNYQTTDAYEDSRIIDMRLFDGCLITIVNTHSANGLKYQILGCIEPPYLTEVSEQVLAGGAQGSQSITKRYAFLKVQVKSSISATPATLECFGGLHH